MASINDGVDIIYGNHNNAEFGVKLATAFSSTTRSGNVETREIITSYNPSNKTFGFHGIKYNSPNTFDLILYNEDGTFIDVDQERQLKKWLMTSKYNWLDVNQDSLNAISYYCIATQCTILDVGAYSGAMLVSFQTDSNSAWSNMNTKQYSVSGTQSFKLYMDTDYDDELILPTVTIIPTSNGNISIKNVTRNEEIIINNCVLGEVIILDSFSGKISTTSNDLLIDRWNKRYLKLQDEYNNILLTGDFNLTIQYRQQIRVGA